MITGQRGYPTQSWGRNGYGLECADAKTATAAVDRLHQAGVDLIKISIVDQHDLEPSALRAAIQRAHALGLKVAVHALDNESARAAADAGADILAHTPITRLSDATVAAWKRRSVISTLGAFGGRGPATENLRRLHAAGTRVLYGTDLGNTRTAGINRGELELLRDAGIPARDILAAGTSEPAQFWGFDQLGGLEVGKRASFLLLDTDPLHDITVLARPAQVWISGKKRL